MCLPDALGGPSASGDGEAAVDLVPSYHLRYRQLLSQIRELMPTVVPAAATVLVAAKGDDELLKAVGRRAWHFPQTADGEFAGHNPADSAEAISQLEALRAR